jgi:MFS family permease
MPNPAESFRFYRWIVVAAAGIGLGGAYGGITTISVLIGPLETEYGWLRSEIAFAYTLLAMGAAAGGLAAGRLADRLPPAPIATVGVLVIGIGLALVAHTTSLAQIQAIYLTLGLVGFSCLTTPLLATVSLWFDRQAGLALGLATAGGTLGQAIVPPIFEALVAAQGWRSACALFAFGFVVLLLPAAALVRKPPVPAATVSSGATASWPLPAVASVALLSAAALLCCVLMGVPSVHLVAFATGEGLASAEATRVVTVLMLAGAAGRIITGGIVDRLGPIATYALVSAIQTAAVTHFPTAGTGLSLYALAALYGFGFGGVMTALVCAVRASVPREALGTAMAVVSLLVWIGMGAGGYGAGLCFDRSGSYDLSFKLAALAGLGNLAVLALLAALIMFVRVPMFSARPLAA